jgi:glycosyltransferase involved in cell wall biosynthesis
MKVLHVINQLGPGGAEKLLLTYLMSANSDNQNELCLLYQTDESIYRSLKKRQLEVHAFNFTKKYQLGIIIKLWRLIRDNQYDLVHVHLFPAQYFCALVAFFNRKTKFVFSEHNSYNRRRKLKICRILDFLSYLPYQKIVCVSEATQKDLLSWLPSLKLKTTIIYNGVPISQQPEKDVNYDIVLIGSLRSKVKGVDLLLKAVSTMRFEINQVAIAGTGRYMLELIRLRNELGLEKKVQFLGNQDDINYLLARSKVLAMPSRWEGLPIVLLEAMAAGKPIIASKVGGIPEVIIDGYNGILIPPDDVKALSDAIQKLLMDNQYASKIGRQAYQDVALKYSMAIYITHIHDLYKAIS